jgi:hypothetical protein
MLSNGIHFLFLKFIGQKGRQDVKEPDFVLQVSPADKTDDKVKDEFHISV